MQVGDRLRRETDGQLGFYDEDDEGRACVRLDRPAERRLVPYSEREWSPEQAPKLTPMAVASVAYEADARLRYLLGEYNVRGWIGLKDAERMPWLKGPPAGAAELRQRLYEAIRRELEAG